MKSGWNCFDTVIFIDREQQNYVKRTYLNWCIFPHSALRMQLTKVLTKAITQRGRPSQKAIEKEITKYQIKTTGVESEWTIQSSLLQCKIGIGGRHSKAWTHKMDKGKHRMATLTGTKCKGAQETHRWFCSGEGKSVKGLEIKGKEMHGN